jgi:type IX secretion system PorP/SprF family membrane protein
MIRACIHILLLLSLQVTAMAQQRPYYTQYIMNNYLLNPAITGIENYYDIKVGYRSQWVGIQGAPVTTYLTIHGPIGKKDYRQTSTSFDVPGENPRGKSYWEQYTAPEPHHGIGGSIIKYQTGYINRMFVNLSYAYHIGLTPKMSLAGGFAAGFSTTSIDASKIELANPADPAIGTTIGTLRKFKPDLSAGLWLYSDRFFVGVSTQQVIPQHFSLVDHDYDRSTLVPHWFATAGYRFFLSDEVSVLPSVMTRYIPDQPVFVDVNIKFQYLDRVWLGGNIRFQEGFAAMAGVNISSKWNISYAYDVNNSKYMLQSQQRGTHEIMIGFLLGNEYGDMCPRNVW